MKSGGRVNLRGGGCAKIGVKKTLTEEFIMAKLCAKGKAAAKRKFKVYPSAYANMYASGVCSGKITPGGKKGSRKKAANGGLMAGMTRKRRASCA
jgi:hypothetical protein